MPGNPNEIKLVNNAMSNATRRKIMNFLVDGDRTVEEIGAAAGKAMLDFHLKLLQQAGLIELKEETAGLTEYGRNFLKGKEEKNQGKSADLLQAKPVEITEVRQLLPCIADSSKFRIIANMAPPLGGVLKVLEPIFSRGRYSDGIGALIIQQNEVITTIYGTGKVTMTMIKSEEEARDRLENLKSTLNEAIAKGVAPAPREKIRVEPMEIYKYLPQTNCGKCSEQSCYTFAIKLMGGEVTLDKCTPLKEPGYSTNFEHLQVLSAYI
ncbi:ArsR family transcriptional regulator [Methanosarcina sp. DH2]|uniref:(Fe-S)-binding protein n=1 Tax=Methanosarcina sp. DH2 TaxID=2605639 RepID=UPI001E524698|nr:(Fe-S)-binding protein [Methanosarcina sp. DH2]MCC4769173.1 ArsR family transcriptional regulator [Methanosarcina sp. DH2]